MKHHEQLVDRHITELRNNWFNPEVSKERAIATLITSVAQEVHDAAPKNGLGPMYLPSDFTHYAEAILELINAKEGEVKAAAYYRTYLVKKGWFKSVYNASFKCGLCSENVWNKQFHNSVDVGRYANCPMCGAQNLLYYAEHGFDGEGDEYNPYNIR